MFVALPRRSLGTEGPCRDCREITAQLLELIGTEIYHAFHQGAERSCTPHMRILLDARLDLRKSVNFRKAYRDQQLRRQNESERKGHKVGCLILYSERHADVEHLSLRSQSARTLDFLQRFS